MPRIGLLGVPVDANSSHLRGCASAPAAIRAQLVSGSANWFAEDGTDTESVIDDRGDVAVGNEVASEHDHTLIREAVAGIIASEQAPLVIGGDHSVTYPAVAAVAAHVPELTIVHVDAHPDLYGDFEGNRLSHASPFARIMEEGLCSRLVQLGIRTATTHQREQADRFGVETVPVAAVAGFDAAAVRGPVYLTIDLDGLDPAFAPGVSHHEPGGLSTRDVIRIVNGIGGRIVAGDIVELNPVRDVNGVTAMVAAKLLREMAAAMARG